MTLTAPACPVASQMPPMVANALNDLETTGRITVTLTWDPPWSMDLMSEDARLALGF
jgi:metal-sulfur cluster biosynthetic enzyme